MLHTQRKGLENIQLLLRKVLHVGGISKNHYKNNTLTERPAHPPTQRNNSDPLTKLKGEPQEYHTYITVSLHFPVDVKHTVFLGVITGHGLSLIKFVIP